MAATTEMLARPAPRPAYSVLGSERATPIRLPALAARASPSTCAERQRRGSAAAA